MLLTRSQPLHATPGFRLRSSQHAPAVGARRRSRALLHHVLLHLPWAPAGKPRTLPRVGPARTCVRRSVAAVRRARSAVCSSSAAAQNASGSYARLGAVKGGAAHGRLLSIGRSVACHSLRCGLRHAVTLNILSNSMTKVHAQL